MKDNQIDGISIDLREQVWTIINTLTEDEEPTVEFEIERAKEGSFNPATASINTVRGEAMHAMMYYVMWVKRNIEAKVEGKENTPFSFDIIPEARKVL